ncbi:MAG TPA: EamA family transporter [Vicinamibacteria bacterium]|nr:EamA family transporter [Vicinamibacteria bacterium]
MRPVAGKVLAAFLVLTVVWGTTWAVIRVGLAGIPPFTGVALRFAIAGTLLLGLARYQRIPLGKSRRERALWVVNGILSFCLSYSVVYWCEQYLPSGLTSVLFATNPLMVAGLAHLALPGERLSRSGLAGLLLGLAGVAVIFSDDLRLLGGEQVRTAAAVMLISPAAAALSSVAIKRWGSGIHPVSLSAVPMLFCAAVMTPIALVVERRLPVVLDARSVAALLYLAGLGSALAFTIYYWLLARVSATRTSLISYLIPIVAVAIGAAVFAEPLRPRLITGSALVLAGVVLVTALRLPRAPQRPARGGPTID